MPNPAEIAYNDSLPLGEGWGGAVSLYRSAHDARGEYVDMETGEIIQQMTIREFLLSDRWKAPVLRLRQMVEQYGKAEAKAMPEYRELKESLPGATLSATFSYRRQADVLSHTGWLVLDIDWQDNKHLHPDAILRTLKDIPSIGLIMKSCSGTGYLALAKLAPPTKQEQSFLLKQWNEANKNTLPLGGMGWALFHKARTLAFYTEYGSIGVNFDRACSDITRLRFATYDGNPIIKEVAQPYDGFQPEKVKPMPKMLTNYQPKDKTLEQIYNEVDRLITIAEQRNIDISGKNYKAWIIIGMSLYSLGDYSLWERVCRLRGPSHDNGHTIREQRQAWRSFRGSNVSIFHFYNVCKDNGVTLR